MWTPDGEALGTCTEYDFGDGWRPRLPPPRRHHPPSAPASPLHRPPSPDQPRADIEPLPPRRLRGGAALHRNAPVIEVDMSLELSIGHLAHAGLLEPGATALWPSRMLHSSGADQVGWIMREGFGELHYFRDQALIASPQRIDFARSRMANRLYHRPWFLCPAGHHRVGRLYCFEGEPVAKCRICHGALHLTTTLYPHERALHRARAIWERLGGSTGDVAILPAIPPCMKRMTYRALAREHAERMRQYHAGAAAGAGVTRYGAEMVAWTR